MRIALLRHAHSIANERDLIDSQGECLGLSAKGLEQARKLIPLINRYNPENIFVSPAKRAKQTIEPFLEGASEVKVIETSLVHERNAGEFTWQHSEAVKGYCEKN